MEVKVADAAYIDFAQLKEQVTLEQCARMLGLTMKQVPGGFRAPCPVHTGNPRALAITPGKGFFCFGTHKGGDQIALVAHCRNCSSREAAAEIAKHFGNSTVPGTVPGRGAGTVPRGTVPPASQERTRGFDPEAYAKTLDPDHVALEPLQIAPATLQDFTAGYSGSGVNRGRLAVALRDRNGTVLAFAGRAISDEQQPRLTVPNGFDISSVIFGADRVETGPLYLVRDPLDVMRAYENGVTNVVSMLTEGISPQQLEQLASLMDERKCETVDLF